MRGRDGGGAARLPVRLRLALAVGRIRVRTDPPQVSIAASLPSLLFGLLMVGAVTAGIRFRDPLPLVLGTAGVGGVWLLRATSRCRLDGRGLLVRPLPWHPPVHYRWEDIRSFELVPAGRAGLPLLVELRDRPEGWLSVSGASGMVRSTRPLRVLGAAAVLGLLPEGLPVVVRSAPRLPSSRAAYRLLTRHHRGAVVVPLPPPDPVR